MLERLGVGRPVLDAAHGVPMQQLEHLVEGVRGHGGDPAAEEVRLHGAQGLGQVGLGDNAVLVGGDGAEEVGVHDAQVEQAEP